MSEGKGRIWFADVVRDGELWILPVYSQPAGSDTVWRMPHYLSSPARIAGEVASVRALNPGWHVADYVCSCVRSGAAACEYIERYGEGAHT